MYYTFRYMLISLTLHRYGTHLSEHYTSIIYDGEKRWFYDGLAKTPHVIPMDKMVFTTHRPQHCLYILLNDT